MGASHGRIARAQEKCIVNYAQTEPDAEGNVTQAAVIDVNCVRSNLGKRYQQ